MREQSSSLIYSVKWEKRALSNLTTKLERYYRIMYPFPPLCDPPPHQGNTATVQGWFPAAVVGPRSRGPEWQSDFQPVKTGSKASRGDGERAALHCTLYCTA